MSSPTSPTAIKTTVVDACPSKSSTTSSPRPPTPAPSPTPNIFTSRLYKSKPRNNLKNTQNEVFGSSLSEHISKTFPSSHQPPKIQASSQLLDSVRSSFVLLNDEERSMFVQGLLSLCGREVLVSASDFLSPLLKKDPFTYFPHEISLRIISYIDDPQTLARACQVSKLWYLILSDDLTWKELCNSHQFRRLSAALNIDHQNRMSRLPSISAESAAIKSGELAEAIYNPDATRRPIPRSYRSHFKQQYMLNSAWNSGGRLAAKYVIESPGVATALIMAGRYIVVALDNSKIFVFREDGKMLRSLFGHVMGVWALTLMGNTLVSGGCDRDVRVWDLKTGNCMQILKGHSSTVRCLQMVDENTAVSGSRDTTVRVWDIRSGQCLQVLEGHNSSVRCLEVVGDICVSGSYDFTAKVWRISDGALLHTLSGHFSQIYCLAFDGKKIATGSLDASIRVWDVETGSCLGILQGHTSLVGQLQMKNDILVSGGSDGAVRVWELQNYTCVHRFAAHDNSVTSLQFDDSRIVSGGSDGRIRVWDMTTGLHIRDLSGHFDSVWRVAFKDEKVTIAASRNGKIYLELTSFTPSTDDYDMTMPSIEFRTSIHSNSVEKTDVEMSSYDVDPIDSTKPNDSPPASISAKRDPNDMDCS